LRLNARVREAFVDRARSLPDTTQTLLLVAAADDTADAALIFRAASTLGVDAAALEPAERAGLASVEMGCFAFRHPLVRAAVYHAATLAARWSAHRALAVALVGDQHAARRAWHLAATATGPDEAVADELERSGAAA